MAETDIAALIKRAEKARGRRQQFATLMRDVYAYAMPERDGWNAYGYGADRQVAVYDSTAVLATGRFANRVQQALFPTGQRWAELTLPPELSTRDEAQPLQRDLDAATDLLFAYIADSNFDLAINEWAQELAAGTACLLIENGRLGTRRSRAPLLRFQAIPAAMVGPEEGPFGTVESTFTDQKLPARLIRRTYPDATDLPRELQDAEAQDGDREVELLQAITYDADDDVFRFEVIHAASRTRIVSRRYRTIPMPVTRWTKAPGEIHGRGPLTQVLPDVRTVNKLVELALQSGSLGVAGVWTAADDGVLNPATVTIVPGAVIPVRSNGGALGPSLRALEFPGNYALNRELREDMIGRIRFGMFDDPLPPEVVPNVTATEIIERTRRFQADTGAIGRLIAEAVSPVVRRCLDILDQAGVFGAPRFAGLMRAVQEDAIRIRATSPLARAQDQSDAAAVQGFIGQAAQLGEAGAAIIRAGIDLDRAGPWYAAKVGVPQMLIPTERERQEREAAAAQAAQQAQMLASPAVAQLAGAAGRAMADGAAAETPQGASQGAPA